jgi:hypothetical protein
MSEPDWRRAFTHLIGEMGSSPFGMAYICEKFGRGETPEIFDWILRCGFVRKWAELPQIFVMLTSLRDRPRELRQVWDQIPRPYKGRALVPILDKGELRERVIDSICGAFLVRTATTTTMTFDVESFSFDANDPLLQLALSTPHTARSCLVCAMRAPCGWRLTCSIIRNVNTFWIEPEFILCGINNCPLDGTESDLRVLFNEYIRRHKRAVAMLLIRAQMEVSSVSKTSPFVSSTPSSPLSLIAHDRYLIEQIAQYVAS